MGTGSREPGRLAIEVCIRCTRVLRPNNDATEERHYGRWWWRCADGDPACKRGQTENRIRHAREIERRMRSTEHSHLIVVCDRFGAKWGYGNYYVGVPHGADPAAVAAPYADDPELVVESILPLPRPL